MRLSENDDFGTQEEETCFGCGDCSVYCAIENEFIIISSSHLPNQGNNTYTAENVDDYNLQKAWVEGAKGQGIGEWIEFRFEKDSFTGSDIKINGLYLFNGYRKSKSAWANNSRIKKLKVSVNNTDFLSLNIHDSYKFQSIEFDELKLAELHSIQFTILETFKGEKYDDVALSELKLRGIHHH